MLVWCRWSLLGLLALQLVWFGWLHPSPSLSVPLVISLTAGPLLLALLLAWQLKPRALVIAGLVLLVYFAVGVMEAWANPSVRWLALVQVALVLVYFTALATIRRDRRPARRPAE